MTNTKPAASILLRNDSGRLITAFRVPADESPEVWAEMFAGLYPPGWTAEAVTAGGAQLALHHAPEG
jgi:hypothetical protein